MSALEIIDLINNIIKLYDKEDDFKSDNNFIKENVNLLKLIMIISYLMMMNCQIEIYTKNFLKCKRTS